MRNKRETDISQYKDIQQNELSEKADGGVKRFFRGFGKFLITVCSVCLVALLITGISLAVYIFTIASEPTMHPRQLYLADPGNIADRGHSNTALDCRAHPRHDRLNALGVLLHPLLGKVTGSSRATWAALNFLCLGVLAHSLPLLFW
jgi:hypothetical protein